MKGSAVTWQNFSSKMMITIILNFLVLIGRVFCSSKERLAATESLVRNYQLPNDLIRIVDQWTPDNDWLRLKNTFHSTPRTQCIIEMADCSFKDYNVTHNKLIDNFGRDIEIITNSEGRIITLLLNGLGLLDEDIADISNLPRKIETLSLDFNALATLDIGKLPRTVKELRLDRNRFKSFHVNLLPPEIIRVSITDNRIRNVTLEGMPRTLESLDLQHNKVGRLGMGHVPTTLLSLRLEGNRAIWFDPGMGNGRLTRIYNQPYLFWWLTTSSEGQHQLLLSKDPGAWNYRKNSRVTCHCSMM